MGAIWLNLEQPELLPGWNVAEIISMDDFRTFMYAWGALPDRIVHLCALVFNHGMELKMHPNYDVFSKAPAQLLRHSELRLQTNILCFLLALENVDYRPENTSITLNQQRLCLRLRIILDNLPEGLENFVISIKEVVPEVGLVIFPNVATVIIEGISQSCLFDVLL